MQHDVAHLHLHPQHDLLNDELHACTWCLPQGGEQKENMTPLMLSENRATYCVTDKVWTDKGLDRQGLDPLGKPVR